MSKRLRTYPSPYRTTILGVVLSVFIGLSRGTHADTNIVWNDEFLGTALSTRNWTYDIDNGFWVPNPGYWVPGWGNNELEYYTSRTQNVYVAEGMLHIRAQQEAYGGQSYTSGRIKTMGLFSKRYGRFEFRAKLPAGVGLWPALWMLPQTGTYGGWPNSGEIDIMENNGANPSQVGGAIHFGGANGNDVYFSQSFTFPDTDSVTNFHIYALEWSANAVSWSVDGHLYETQTNWWSNVGTSTNTYPYPAPFDQPFFIIMNLAIGGNYLGNPPTNTINASLPAEMLVDYVRVYDQSPPLALSFVQAGNGSLVLSWPANIVCHLQALTNLMGLAAGQTWSDLAGATPPFALRPAGSNDAAFYRLESP